MGDCIASAVL